MKEELGQAAIIALILLAIALASFLFVNTRYHTKYLKVVYRNNSTLVLQNPVTGETFIGNSQLSNTFKKIHWAGGIQ